MASNKPLGGVVGRPIGTALDFGVLGDVTVADGTQLLSLGGQKQRVVMAMLIVAAGGPTQSSTPTQPARGTERPQG